MKGLTAVLVVVFLLSAASATWAHDTRPRRRCHQPHCNCVGQVVAGTFGVIGDIAETTGDVFGGVFHSLGGLFNRTGQRFCAPPQLQPCYEPLIPSYYGEQVSPPQYYRY